MCFFIQKKLKLEGVSHFSDDIVLSRLKWEFINVNTHTGEKLNGDVDCFQDILDFFQALKKASLAM